MSAEFYKDVRDVALRVRDRVQELEKSVRSSEGRTEILRNQGALSEMEEIEVDLLRVLADNAPCLDEASVCGDCEAQLRHEEALQEIFKPEPQYSPSPDPTPSPEPENQVSPTPNDLETSESYSTPEVSPAPEPQHSPSPSAVS